ncbi:MAG: PHP domain-containing protein [Propionibacteriaceae bacterium]|nr:PHP domain-containing protein [Propionibacteriaceae bacterium]
MRIDLHTHSRVSDGTDTPTMLVMKAFQAGLDVIALTDHDTFDGIPEAQEAGKRIGVKVLPGIEISCRLQGRTVHLLGYGCDMWNRGLNAELAKVRVGRTQRLPEMCERLVGLGIEITIDDVMAVAQGAPSIGRPHVADALVAKGVVKDRQEAFDRYLAEGGPAYVKRYSIDLDHGIDLVHEAKGAAVIAHPWGRKSREVLSAPVIEQLTREHALDGFETDHKEHDRDTRLLLFELGARLGLIRTGSSDHHGAKRPDRELGCFTTRKSAYLELLSRIRSRGGVI